MSTAIGSAATPCAMVQVTANPPVHGQVTPSSGIVLAKAKNPFHLRVTTGSR